MINVFNTNAFRLDGIQYTMGFEFLTSLLDVVKSLGERFLDISLATFATFPGISATNLSYASI